jgi:hypothetical protein
MAKYAFCDNCGAKDDWGSGKGPILADGALIQFRAEGMGDDIEREFELCPECRDELLKHFPNLLKK